MNNTSSRAMEPSGSRGLTPAGAPARKPRKKPKATPATKQGRNSPMPTPYLATAPLPVSSLTPGRIDQLAGSSAAGMVLPSSYSRPSITHTTSSPGPARPTDVAPSPARRRKYAAGLLAPPAIMPGGTASTPRVQGRASPTGGAPLNPRRRSADRVGVGGTTPVVLPAGGSGGLATRRRSEDRLRELGQVNSSVMSLGLLGQIMETDPDASEREGGNQQPARRRRRVVRGEQGLTRRPTVSTREEGRALGVARGASMRRTNVWDDLPESYDPPPAFPFPASTSNRLPPAFETEEARPATSPGAHSSASTERPRSPPPTFEQAIGLLPLPAPLTPSTEIPPPADNAGTSTPRARPSLRVETSASANGSGESSAVSPTATQWASAPSSPVQSENSQEAEENLTLESSAQDREDRRMWNADLLAGYTLEERVRRESERRSSRDIALDTVAEAEIRLSRKSAMNSPLIGARSERLPRAESMSAIPTTPVGVETDDEDPKASPTNPSGTDASSSSSTLPDAPKPIEPAPTSPTPAEPAPSESVPVGMMPIEPATATSLPKAAEEAVGTASSSDAVKSDTVVEAVAGTPSVQRSEHVLSSPAISRNEQVEGMPVLYPPAESHRPLDGQPVGAELDDGLRAGTTAFEPTRTLDGPRPIDNTQANPKEGGLPAEAIALPVASTTQANPKEGGLPAEAIALPVASSEHNAMTSPVHSSVALPAVSPTEAPALLVRRAPQDRPSEEAKKMPHPAVIASSDNVSLSGSDRVVAASPPSRKLTRGKALRRRSSSPKGETVRANSIRSRQSVQEHRPLFTGPGYTAKELEDIPVPARAQQTHRLSAPNVASTAGPVDAGRTIRDRVKSQPNIHARPEQEASVSSSSALPPHREAALKRRESALGGIERRARRSPPKAVMTIAEDPVEEPKSSIATPAKSDVSAPPLIDLDGTWERLMPHSPTTELHSLAATTAELLQLLEDDTIAESSAQGAAKAAAVRAVSEMLDQQEAAAQITPRKKAPPPPPSISLRSNKASSGVQRKPSVLSTADSPILARPRPAKSDDGSGVNHGPPPMPTRRPPPPPPSFISSRTPPPPLPPRPPIASPVSEASARPAAPVRQLSTVSTADSSVSERQAVSPPVPSYQPRPRTSLALRPRGPRPPPVPPRPWAKVVREDLGEMPTSRPRTDRTVSANSLAIDATSQIPSPVRSMSEQDLRTVAPPPRSPEYTDLDVYVSRLEGSGREYEGLAHLTSFLGPAKNPAATPQALSTLLPALIQVDSRRQNAAGKTKLKLSLLGVRVTKCPICLSQFKEKDMGVMLPRCGHVAHEVCARRWFREDWKCFVCREPLDTEGVV